jgi:hypothetical protein
LWSSGRRRIPRIIVDAGLEKLFEISPKVFSIVGLWAVKTTKWGLFRHLCAHSLEPKLGAILNFQTVSRREILRTSP